MHIALLTDGISPYVTGGMQRHSYHLALNLLKKGVQITLVHAVYEDATMPDESEVVALLESNAEQLRVIGIRFPKSIRVPGHYLRESYQYSCTVYEVLKNQWADFDFIYAKGFTAWCLLEHKKKGVHIAPVGVKFHGYEMFQKTANLKGKLTQYLLQPPVVFINRHANVVFSYGGEITEIIKRTGVKSAAIVEIGSGVATDWIRAEPAYSDGKRKFLFIGRNERRKGIPELAASKSVFEKYNAELHWVGPIPESKKQPGKSQFYHGEIRDSEALKKQIDQCQIIVVPSFSEGMPNVILEAMARGLAVIATKVGAVPNMISEENGRLIKPGSRKELQAAIAEMATLPEDDLRKMQNASIAIINARFRWSAVAETTLNTIRTLTFSDSDDVHPEAEENR